MKYTITVVTILALNFSSSVLADQYSASVDGCRNAIGEQMGIAETEVRYKLKKVKTRGRVRDLGFRVSVHDDASPIQNVVVTCKVKRGGEVLALRFADGQYPDLVAQSGK